MAIITGPGRGSQAMGIIAGNVHRHHFVGVLFQSRALSASVGDYYNEQRLCRSKPKLLRQKPIISLQCTEMLI
jgi:hypothetical protein